MNIQRDFNTLHPLLLNNVKKIAKIITDYNLPMKLFETGRSHDRHQWLLDTGKIKDPMQGIGHLHNLKMDPPLYTTSVVYVYFDNNWSWNLRDITIAAWYNLFGNLVLDKCPELEWGGANRKSQDLTLFSLKSSVIYDNLDKYPCTLR